MEFTLCDKSGHLKADGDRGQYWILSNVWVYLERVTPLPNGPTVERLGTFTSVEDAIEKANHLDTL